MQKSNEKENEKKIHLSRKDTKFPILNNGLCL